MVGALVGMTMVVIATIHYTQLATAAAAAIKHRNASFMRTLTYRLLALRAAFALPIPQACHWHRSSRYHTMMASLVVIETLAWLTIKSTTTGQWLTGSTEGAATVGLPACDTCSYGPGG